MTSFDQPLPHGITLRCRGVQRGAQVMLLHGFPEAAFAWDEVVAQLPGLRCVAPNLRGFGGSSAPRAVEAYRPKHLVADVAALIEAQGAPVDVLVAHDWGGAVAWNLAAQRPELLRRLVIVNSPHPAAFVRELRHSAAQQQASAYMNFFCRPDSAERLAADDFRLMWRTFQDAAWLTPALRDAYRAVWRDDLDAQLNYYRASPLRPPASPDDAIHTLQIPDSAVTVRVPTTVLWGMRDHALLPGLLDGLERWVPQLAVQRLPENTHWVAHEDPAAVAAAVSAVQRAI